MNIKLREVHIGDWSFILEMRNEKEIREFSNNCNIITKDEHYCYMNKLEKDDIYQRIVTIDDKNAGYIKIINGEISIMIKKGYRGKGIGSEFIKLVLDEVDKFKTNKIIAKIKVNNIASIKLFKKSGFQQIETIYDQNNNPYEYVMEKYIDPNFQILK